MIYLTPEVKSGLGEDTFWTWFNREFPNSTFDKPTSFKSGDCVLQYSTLGACPPDVISVGLLWELHPEMKMQLQSNEWDNTIEKIHACARTSTINTITSEIMVPFYESFGDYKVLPIGVDTDLFKPSVELRNRAGKLWVGSNHRMKGKDRCPIDAQMVFKEKPILQEALASLMQSYEFFVSTSRLRPYFMVEWEAMAAGLKMLDLSGLNRDFVPSDDPRQDVFDRGWDRHTTKTTWGNFLHELGVKV